jgi:hypothetical protein
MGHFLLPSACIEKVFFVTLSSRQTRHRCRRREAPNSGPSAEHGLAMKPSQQARRDIFVTPPVRCNNEGHPQMRDIRRVQHFPIFPLGWQALCLLNNKINSTADDIAMVIRRMENGKDEDITFQRSRPRLQFRGPWKDGRRGTEEGGRSCPERARTQRDGRFTR